MGELAQHSAALEQRVGELEAALANQAAAAARAAEEAERRLQEVLSLSPCLLAFWSSQMILHCEGHKEQCWILPG